MKTENHYTETDLGNISLNPRGEYAPESFYEYLDTVNFGGGSYMCLAELGTKITGIPPVPGTNTEHWQILTLPGGLTPEYITMHDEVVEKSKQVEVSRAAVELSQSEIEAIQADVAQLHKDTQDSAQSALTSKNQAAGYASAADTSRQAAERAKQDVDAQIPNIDAKLQAALNEIDTTRQSANTAVKKQEELSVQAVKDQTGTYITEQKNLAKQELDEKVNAFGLDVDAIKKQVSDEGAKQVEATRTAGNTAVQEIGTVKSTAVQEVQTEGTAQIEKVSAKGTEQVQAAADTGAQQVQLVKTEGQKQLADVQQAAQEIVADREQIAQNKAGIEALKQGKADAIVETASGEIIQIEDSSGLGFEGLRFFGKSMQDGVPSPESPVPIVNVGDKGNIALKIDGDTPPQSLTLATPNGLPGIKVDSDGSYTDENGQQWICDEIDLERGKYVQRVENDIITGGFANNGGVSNKIYKAMRDLRNSYTSGTCNIISNMFANKKDATAEGITQGYGQIYLKLYIDRLKGEGSTIEDVNAFVKAHPFKVIYKLHAPIERDLTPEEIAAYKALHTNYPTTVISNDESAYMEVSYVADTKNYIDKKFKELSQAIVNTQIALL